MHRPRTNEALFMIFSFFLRVDEKDGNNRKIDVKWQALIKTLLLKLALKLLLKQILVLQAYLLNYTLRVDKLLFYRKKRDRGFSPKPHWFGYSTDCMTRQ